MIRWFPPGPAMPEVHSSASNEDLKTFRVTAVSRKLEIR